MTDFLRDLLRRYGALAQSADSGLRLCEGSLAPMTLVTLQADPMERMHDPQAVEKRLDGLDSACDGWCRRESGVYRRPVSPHKADGPPLDGEWVSASGDTSCHMRFMSGAWCFWLLTENAIGGQPVLREAVSLRAAPGHQVRRLRYAIYWAADAGLRPIASRFLGFDEDARS